MKITARLQPNTESIVDLVGKILVCRDRLADSGDRADSDQRHHAANLMDRALGPSVDLPGLMSRIGRNRGWLGGNHA